MPISLEKSEQSLINNQNILPHDQPASIYPDLLPDHLPDRLPASASTKAFYLRLFRRKRLDGRTRMYARIFAFLAAACFLSWVALYAWDLGSLSFPLAPIHAHFHGRPAWVRYLNNVFMFISMVLVFTGGAIASSQLKLRPMIIPTALSYLIALSLMIVMHDTRPPLAAGHYNAHLVSSHHLGYLAQSHRGHLNAAALALLQSDIRWLSSHPHDWYDGTKAPQNSHQRQMDYLARVEKAADSPYTAPVRSFILSQKSALAQETLTLDQLFDAFFAYFVLTLFVGIFQQFIHRSIVEVEGEMVKGI